MHKAAGSCGEAGALTSLLEPEHWTEGTENLLGLGKPPSQTRVVVAMSGGVDSSVVAAMLHRRGYQVIGMTLRLYDGQQDVRRPGACCAGQDIHDARRVAERFGFPHYVLDYESVFAEAVIEEFADSYLRGETPIPCVRCNEQVKFHDLLATARELGADVLATGHYVRSHRANGEWLLYRGRDPRRDQSYFLFSLTQKQLDFLRFPLGDLHKGDVRRLAECLDLPVATKPDSQDICFVPDGDYAAVIERLRPGAAEPGPILDVGGRTLGRHRGIIHYTIGQRRGLGIGGLSEPLYVVGLDVERRAVVVGPREALAVPEMCLREVSWIAGDHAEEEDAVRATEIAVNVRIRNSHSPVPSRILGRDLDGLLRVRFDTPAYGVSPGQAAVFYDGDQVLGGGWIARALPAWKRSAA
ncbi:MAG: tRNA 2-thiouridine(34) synthase MnmA [Alphaproteobacteria bacterium]|nr:MAG: tRNA 2-thiouridine(34) synthase MnmA [Alphaproteobacteria bacterium]